MLKKVGDEKKLEWGHWVIHAGFVGIYIFIVVVKTQLTKFSKETL